MNKIIEQSKIAFKLLLIFTVITGVIYPCLITILAQILFPFQSNGSLIIKNQEVIGSELIGQFFSDPKYFFSRPSVTKKFPYNPMYSGGSNLGPMNVLLIKEITPRITELKKTDPHNAKAIPIELITSSGSGLDPHITPMAAFYQAGRISKIRNVSINIINNLINKHIEKPQFWFLGNARVNVLKLNLALDNLE